MTAVPAKPGSGVKVTFPAPSTIVPWVSGPGVTAVTVKVCRRSSNGPAASLAVRPAAGTTVWPARAVTVSGCGTGGSLTAVTLIVTVAGADWSLPSLAVKVNASGPLKSGAGV